MAGEKLTVNVTVNDLLIRSVLGRGSSLDSGLRDELGADQLGRLKMCRNYLEKLTFLSSSMPLESIANESDLCLQRPRLE